MKRWNESSIFFIYYQMKEVYLIKTKELLWVGTTVFPLRQWIRKAVN
jgi:hypothetical protein